MFASGDKVKWRFAPCPQRCSAPGAASFSLPLHRMVDKELTSLGRQLGSRFVSAFVSIPTSLQQTGCVAQIARVFTVSRRRQA
eukprot:688313-Pleurochrysis_carterae.AAC.2